MLSLAFAVGGCLGSFFNVVVWRLPRGESVVHPGSRCPHCRRAIPFYRNLPIVTWLLQRGKCAWCEAPIPVFYVAVEVFCAVLGAAWTWGWITGFWTDPARAMGWGIFALFAVPISLIDWEHFEIPDSLVVLAGFGGLLVSGVGQLPEDRLRSVLESGKSAFLAAGFLYAIFFLARVGLGLWGSLTRALLPKGIRWSWRRGVRKEFLALALRWGRFHPDMEALGLGDVSLALAAGACLGFPAVFVGLAPAAGLGAVAFVYRRSRPLHLARATELGIDPQAIPFGPFLCAGFLLAALWIPFEGLPF